VRLVLRVKTNRGYDDEDYGVHGFTSGTAGAVLIDNVVANGWAASNGNFESSNAINNNVGVAANVAWKSTGKPPGVFFHPHDLSQLPFNPANPASCTMTGKVISVGDHDNAEKPSGLFGTTEQERMDGIVSPTINLTSTGPGDYNGMGIDQEIAAREIVLRSNVYAALFDREVTGVSWTLGVQSFPALQANGGKCWGSINTPTTASTNIGPICVTRVARLRQDGLIRTSNASGTPDSIRVFLGKQSDCFTVGLSAAECAPSSGPYAGGYFDQVSVGFMTCSNSSPTLTSVPASTAPGSGVVGDGSLDAWLNARNQASASSRNEAHTTVCDVDPCTHGFPLINHEGFNASSNHLAIITRLGGDLQGSYDWQLEPVVEIVDLDAHTPPIAGALWSGLTRYHGPPGHEWNYDLMLSVFGITTDVQGNIYVAQSDEMGGNILFGGNGGPVHTPANTIFRIDAHSGIATPFCTLPVVHLGNIAYDPEHNQLFATCRERFDTFDSHIYRIDATTGDVLQVYVPPIPQKLCIREDDIKEQWNLWPFGIEWHAGRVYYALNGSDDDCGHCPDPFYIRSFDLTTTGEADVSTDVLERTIPYGDNVNPWIREIPDLSFSPVNGRMLVSTAGKYVLELSCTATGWEPSGTIFERPNAYLYSQTFGDLGGLAGGVAYDPVGHPETNGRVWVGSGAMVPSSRGGFMAMPGTGGSADDSYLVETVAPLAPPQDEVAAYGLDIVLPCTRVCGPPTDCTGRETVRFEFDDPSDIGKSTAVPNIHGTPGAASPVLGHCGIGLRFLPNNNVDEFTVSDNDLLDVTGKLSASVWIRIRGKQSTDNNPGCAEGTIFSKGGNYWFQVGRDNDRLVFQNEGSGSEVAIGYYDFEPGEWTQVGFVRGPWDGTSQQIQLYVNGCPIQTLVSDNGNAESGLHHQASANSAPLMVGNGNVPSTCEFNGDIDDIRIFSRELSHEEMFGILACPCDTIYPCDPVDSLVINTAWNHGTSTLLGLGHPDNHWTQVLDPDDGTHEPRPTYVIDPISGTEPNSRWISSTPPDPAGNPGLPGTYGYEYAFCLRDSLAASLNMCVRAPASVTVELNGTQVLGPVTPGGSCIPLVVTDPALFKPGKNRLRVNVTAVPAVPNMGIDVAGEIRGHEPGYAECCEDSSAALEGRVWIDQNSNAQYDSGEFFWISRTVELSNGATTKTDWNGNYYFMGLPSGAYTIRLPVSNPWTLTYPQVAPHTHSVNLDRGEVLGNLDFGLVGGPVDVSDHIRPPSSFAITRISPNPLVTGSTITYTLPQRAVVSLKIYDVVGRLIADLSPGSLSAGEHRAVWNGLQLTGERAKAGVYMIRMRAGDEAITSRVVLMH